MLKYGSTDLWIRKDEVYETSFFGTRKRGYVGETRVMYDFGKPMKVTSAHLYLDGYGRPWLATGPWDRKRIKVISEHLNSNTNTNTHEE